MNGWFNPDGWMDILDHFLLILGATAVAVIPSWYAAKSHREIKDVKDQVANGHQVPLRVDLDKVLSRLDEVWSNIHEINRGVSGLRAELIDEESRRRDNVRELRFEMERNRTELRDGVHHIERRLGDLEREIKPNE